MANTKAVSNEQIIAALLQHGTVKEAAAAAGTAPRTIYDRMTDKDFKAAYSEAKTDVLRAAVFSINSRLSAAVDVIAGIMTDEEATPATRLQAAQIILNHGLKFSDRLTKDERANQLERDPAFDIFG